METAENMAARNQENGRANKDFEDVETYVSKKVDEVSSKMGHVLSKYRSPKYFEPSPSDFFIIPWMTSGTTLMQNMFYQLMVATKRVATDPTGLDYRDISMVVPFAEITHISGVHSPVHRYHPVGWKSHSDISCFTAERYRDCRFIYLLRDERQVARSCTAYGIDWAVDLNHSDEVRKKFYHRFFLRCFLACEPVDGSEEPDKWVFPAGPAWWFAHAKGFVDCDLPNLLFVLYEDMVADLDKTVRAIADFLKKAIDDEVVQHVVSASDREKMANDTRFRDQLVSEGMGLDVSGGRCV